MVEPVIASGVYMPINQKEIDVIDLQVYWLILKRRWLVILLVMASVLGAAISYTYSQKPVYQAKGKLLFEKKDGVSSLTSLAASVGELGGVGNNSNPIDTEAEVIRSHPLITKTINQLRIKNTKGEPIEIDVFLKQLKLQTIRGTDVMELSYNSTNPQEAADTVNTLMKYYLDNNILINRSQATAARKFLSQELPRIEKQVTKAELELRRFKEINRVVALDAEAKVGIETLGRIDEVITQAQGQLAAAYTRSLALQNELQLSTQQAVALSSLSQIPGVQQVLTEYQKTQQELAIAETTYTSDNPKVVNLQLKEQALKKQLQERVSQSIGNVEVLQQSNLQIGELKQALTQDLVRSEVERLALANQVKALQSVFIINRRRLDSLPRLEQQQLQLQRQLQVAQGTYQQLLKQLQEVQVLENQNVGNARVISSALIPEIPISPRTALNIGIGGIVGLVLGVGTALMLETLDKSVKNIEELNRIIDLPMLGTIPQYENTKRQKNQEQEENQRELPVLDNPYSPVSTSFEMLQTNLGFATDKELQVILLTSSSPSEGKSFVSANLALAASHLGKRVLIVDADLRRPRQHKVWGLPNFVGLSNVLVAQTQLENCLQDVSSVNVLTAGKVPPNPVTLLDSQSMASLIAAARQNYDFVIIDTPPLTAVADALIVGKLVDGVLLIVRPGQVESSAVKASNLLLIQSKVPVLGMVVNGVSEDSGYGGYYYYRGYYGDSKDKQEGDSLAIKR
jgi:capsular exopolysaccharide synthesis family protein